jgi:hypothetical protein
VALTSVRDRPIGLSRAPAPRRAATRIRLQALAWQAAVALSALLAGAAAARPSSLRLALAAAGIVLAAGLASRAGPGLIYLLVIWTTLMGMVRRLLDGSTVANQTDPLLLIAVAALVVLTAAAAERGAFRNRTQLGSAVLMFNLVTAFEALNPLQGSIQAGVTGLAFLLVPSLAFWIGRGLCTDRVVSQILRLLAVLSLVVAGYGLIQTFAGFPSWDARWIQNSGYISLNVNGIIRAFGSFASGQEYAVYLSVGVVVWVAYGFGVRRALLTIAAITLLMVALFYDSSRTPIVTTVFAAGLLIAAAKMRNPVLALILGVGAVALIPVVVGHFAGSNDNNPYAGGLAGHQVSGLAHPFNSQSSTLAGHFGEVTNGFKIMFHHPLGEGVSVVNIAGAKLGAVESNSEYDPSNVAIALGVPGLLAYLAIVFGGFKVAIQQASQRRDVLARAALGIIAVTFLQWTNGGLYSVAYLPWLMLGWLDSLPTREVGPPYQALSPADLPLPGARLPAPVGI